MNEGKKRVLYKKNERFAIKHIVTDFERIDEVTCSIERGELFSDMKLARDEAIDIIDITYLQQNEKIHIILHYAITGPKS